MYGLRGEILRVHESVILVLICRVAEQQRK